MNLPQQFQCGKCFFPVFKIGVFVVFILFGNVSTTETNFLSTVNIVELTFNPELNQIKIYNENLFKANVSKSFIDSVKIQGNFLTDLANIKSIITNLKPVILIRVSLDFESKIRMICYHEKLLRLLVEELNTTLVFFGKLYSCSTDNNPKLMDQIPVIRSFSKRVFILSVTQIQYEIMIRDLMLLDQNVWKEAVIIYDNANAFSRFRRAFESTDKLLHIRYWKKDVSHNADIIRTLFRMKNFILDMSDNNVQYFFLLAAELGLLNSMVTNIMVIEQDNVVDYIRNFAFMSANITVIRATLLYNDSYEDTFVNENYFDQKKEKFSLQVNNMFLSNLRTALNNTRIISVINKNRPDYIPPSVWVDEFNISISKEVAMLQDEKLDYYFHFKFETVYLGGSKLSRISHWTKATGFVPHFKQIQSIKDRLLLDIHNKTFRVTTIEDQIFVKYRTTDEHGQPVTGNDRYTGFTIDLLRALSEMQKFKYVIHTVKDKSFGSRNYFTGEWNGMIGELIKNEADMAVSSLTITYDRERVVDFTTPWMSFGLIVIVKKAKPDVKILQFMAPLSTDIWLLILAAYVAVSLTLYFVGRITPYEWYINHSYENKIENRFSFLNSFWFTVGSLMPQDLSPRAISTRIIGTIWWFFIIIMVSSYIANLAAFRTTERIETGITTIEELAQQSKLKYGCVYGGSTYSFFKNSNISLYKKMWNFMKTDRSVFVENVNKGIEKVLGGNYAFILESPTTEYLCKMNIDLMFLDGSFNFRSYGIGVAAGNHILRDLLSEGILKLQQEQVLEKLRRQWLLGPNSCFYRNNPKSSVPNQLGLETLGGAFLGLLIGLIVSIIVSCAEILVWASRKVLKRREEKMCDIINGQIQLAMCDCKRYKPSKKTSNTSNMQGSPKTCNNFEAGSTTETAT